MLSHPPDPHKTRPSNRYMKQLLVPSNYQENKAQNLIKSTTLIYEAVIHPISPCNSYLNFPHLV